MEVLTNEQPQIIAGCGNCRYFLAGLMEHQMVTMCRRVPPVPVSAPGGTVAFLQPVVDATAFCFQYHPNDETIERSNRLQIPVLIPGTKRASPIVAANAPRTN